MKNMAVGSKRFAGIAVAKLQLVPPEAFTCEARQPLGLPAAGVPKAVGQIVPARSGPLVLKGSQIPYVAVLGSSLKSPFRIAAVGTLKVC